MTAIQVPAKAPSGLALGPRSFTWHLGALALGLIIPAILSTGFLLFQFAQAERTRIETEARFFTRILATAVDREIELVTTTLQALATSPSLLEGDYASFHRQAQRVQAMQGLHVSLRDSAGSTLMTTRLPFGEVVPDLPEEVLATDREAVRDRKTQVSDLFFGPIGRSYAIQVVTPLPEPSTMVLGASLDPAVFGAVLNRFERRDDWIVGIVDGNNRFIARAPVRPGVVGQAATETFRTQASANQGQYYGTNLSGIVSLMTYDSSPATGWKVVVSLPQARIAAAVTRSLIWFLVLTAILCGIGISLAWIMRNRLARAVKAVDGLADDLRSTREPRPLDGLEVTEITRIGHSLLSASEDVRRSEDQLRRVLDNLFAFVGLLDLDGRVREANAAPLVVAGLARDDVIGKPFWDTQWWQGLPESQFRVRRAAEAAMKGETSRFDVEIRGLDGIIIGDFQMAPLRDGEGRIVALQPSAVDVTARVMAQAEISRRENRSRFVADLRDRLDQQADPIAVLDIASKALMAQLGINAVAVHEIDMENRTVRVQAAGALPDFDGALLDFDLMFGARTRKRLLAGEFAAVSDVRTSPDLTSGARAVDAPGVLSWLAAPLFRRNRLVGAFVLAHDAPRQWESDLDLVRLVAERVWNTVETTRLMGALTESEQRLKLGIDVSGLGLGDMEFPADTITLDDRAAEMFGLEAGLPMSRERIHATFHEEDAPALLAAIAELLSPQGSGFMTVEHRVRHPDGSVRWLSVRKQITYEGEGEARRPIDGILVCRDVTAGKAAEEALRRSEERLRGFANSNIIGMLYGDVHGGVSFANDELLRIIGRNRAELEAGSIRWDAITPAEWLPLDEERVAEARERGACTPYEKEYMRPDGERVPVLVGYSLSEPEREQSVAFILDLTETKRISRELAQALERLELAQDAAEVGSWEWSPSGENAFWSKQAIRLHGLPPDWRFDYRQWLSRVHQDDRDKVAAALDATARDPALHYEAEFRVARPDGGWRWLLGRGRAVKDEAGRTARLTGIAIDISPRKELEERQALLVRELHHRIKNTLATVQAIAGQTIRLAPDLESFKTSFAARLGSLGRSHSLLTDAAWENVDLRKLLSAELEPYDLDQRVELKGPPLAIPASMAVPLGMGVHELATNAAKYGALSVPRGRLTVSWDMAISNGQSCLVLDWVERDGPPVKPPSRQGFGSRLLSRVLGAQISGHTDIAYEPEGVRATIVAPLEQAGGSIRLQA